MIQDGQIYRSVFAQIRSWLLANDVEPHDVPVDSPFRIETNVTGRLLHYEVFLRSPDGRFVADERGEPRTEPRTSPLVVDPPRRVWSFLTSDARS